MPAVVNDRCLHLKVVDVPVVLVVQAPQLHVETAVIPQLQLVEKSVTFSDPLYLTVICSVFAFEVQDARLFWEMTSGCFSYSALFGSTLDTCTASVYGALDMYNAGFAGDNVPRAVFPSLSSGPRCSSSWPTGAVLGQGFVHARCCATCGVLVQTVQYWRFRSCSSSRSLVLPVVTQRQIPMILAVQMTISFPQLQLIDNVAGVFVVHVGQVPQVQVVISTSFPCSWYRSWRRQSRFYSCRDPHDKSLTCPLLSTTDAYI